MSDAVDRGITVTELAPMEQAIDVSPDTTAAFVGRALRGPLNKPVLVRDFGEFTGVSAISGRVRASDRLYASSSSTADAVYTSFG